MSNFPECMAEELRGLQEAHDQALARLRRAIRNCFPDGLVVRVRPPYPHMTSTEQGTVVGMEPSLLIRVALAKDPAAVCVVPWQDVLPAAVDD